MALPPDVIDELRRLGENIGWYERIAEDEGDDFVRGFVGKLAESAETFREWHPKLKAFERECRERTPLPDEESLGRDELAKRRILMPRIKAAERPPIKRQAVAPIFSAPISVLEPLMRAWPGTLPNAVFLTMEERRQWNELYSHPEDAFWWFVAQWWHVYDRDLSESFWFQLSPSDFEAVEGEAFWIAEEMLSWGDLAGGCSADLYAWNGEYERLVQSLGCVDF